MLHPPSSRTPRTIVDSAVSHKSRTSSSKFETEKWALAEQMPESTDRASLVNLGEPGHGNPSSLVCSTPRDARG